MIDSRKMSLSPEVEDALSSGKPVVALESTVIAHGLPHPQNIETATRLEAIVREAGAIPATIAILAGRLCVGLSAEQIRYIGESDIKKISIRDLPLAVARNWEGATTVATTSWIAHRAGIAVFATGGIGGVHRGPLPDISADLPELAKTPIVVVCSGAKTVLDLPATREWLETYGITVLGYQCDEMPGFYSRRSGLAIDARVDSAGEVAEIVAARNVLRIQSALLLTVPVPVEAEVDSEVLESLLKAALRRADESGITGRDVTPFLLSEMAKQSSGATLKANLALLENNARVAAGVACALV